MNTISSPWTFYYKFFPTAAWIVVGIVIGGAGIACMFVPLYPVGVTLIIVACLGAGVGYIDRGLARITADEVIDFGSYLAVRRGDVTEHIELARIRRIVYTPGGRHQIPAATLSLRTQSALGSQIRFIPRSGILGITGLEIIAVLRERVDAAVQLRDTQQRQKLEAMRMAIEGQGSGNPAEAPHSGE